MAWRDILVQLRGELADVRARRQRQYEADQVEIQRQRDQLSRMARDLGIVDLIKEMNDILLEGRGELEHIVSWEPVPDHHIADDPESMLDEDVEVEADVITDILTWEEGGELELAVDLGIGDDGVYLQVNGVDIRTEREALEQALIEGFRDELNL
jgi:hypothetical protein